MSISVDEAYAQCQNIARREAKNFYYAFRVLPKRKREAICAVYAFMRHADDLADDERLPLESRLQQTQQWLETWHRAAMGQPTDNPVFIALHDAQQRFRISTELLDQLVQGTMMDLSSPAEQAAATVAEQPARGRVDRSGELGGSAVGVTLRRSSRDNSQMAIYHSFDELYRYCYFVASVVGLVCIRIFGYTDSRAEALAEQTGVAFQLTNILRDVREDAERGRIYLPLEDLESYSVTIKRLASIRGNQQLTLDERALMQMEVDRARKYYAAADSLLPLIASDSRAALWVLVTIYRRLLERIVAKQYQVFGPKIKLPTVEKLSILLRGLWMAFRLRSSPKHESPVS